MFARQFCCDFNKKLFGSMVWSFLHLHQSSIEASPAGHQSSNGLVKSHWKIMVHMSRAYLNEKQMPQTFWYYAIKHFHQDDEHDPGEISGYACFPLHARSWYTPRSKNLAPSLLGVYFHHEKDSNTSRLKSQAHTMDGIVVG